MDKDMAAPFLVTLAYQHVTPCGGRECVGGQRGGVRVQPSSGVVERLLRSVPPAGSATMTRCCWRALADAVEEGRRMQGRDPKRWHYGEYLRIAIHNPVLHEVPLVGKYFDIGPAPMSGSTTTVKQTTRTLAPSMRMNADLATGNARC